jgi:hypothetical protein
MRMRRVNDELASDFMYSWRQRGSGEEPQNPSKKLSKSKTIFRGQPSTKRESAPETLRERTGEANSKQQTTAVK